MNSRWWWCLPIFVGPGWLGYEYQAHPEPPLKWLVFRGVIPFGGGLLVFLGAGFFSGVTASADQPVTRPPISRAIDPFAWLFGSVTLGCAALGDGLVALTTFDTELGHACLFGSALLVWALIAYGLGVFRRALAKPGEYKVRPALAAMALTVAALMVGEAHRVGAILLQKHP